MKTIVLFIVLGIAMGIIFPVGIEVFLTIIATAITIVAFKESKKTGAPVGMNTLMIATIFFMVFLWITELISYLL